ncbi:acyl-CoA dehydratase activase-related protein [Thermoanaerobacterium thermosulfurigenes]|uniref:acyl-CoA dehydratase activase-related protein n=1 Tax=Thermoanaerobacterium thermosulfurigenes TaxID=33950 RepID=UPI003EF8AA4A
MKIGIPKALLYYYYFPFWDVLFKELGIETVLSEDTSKVILDLGVKKAVPEICVPMKVYTGHIINLLDKNVDYIYIPRFVSLSKGTFMCPKFMGLPDMIKGLFDDIDDKILTNSIISKDDDISDFKIYKDFIVRLGVSKYDLKKALKRAREEWLSFRKLNKKGFDINELLDEDTPQKYDGDITIGLLGYVYNVYDRFMNMDLINTLRKMNVKIITFDMLDEKLIKKYQSRFKKEMFWEFTNKIMGAAYNFMEMDIIDGIIQISAFGCGPDSILEPFLSIDSENAKKPYMILRIDEQTGESHILTRIEAFIDLVRIKKQKLKRVKVENTSEGVI